MYSVIDAALFSEGIPVYAIILIVSCVAASLIIVAVLAFSIVRRIRYQIKKKQANIASPQLLNDEASSELLDNDHDEL